MAAKTILTGDAVAKKLFHAKAGREATWGTLFMDSRYGFMGTGNDRMIKEHREFKEHGDQVTDTLTMQMTGQGTVGGAPLEGLESSYKHWPFTYTINELASEVFSAKSKMDQQRVEWSIVKTGEQATREWWIPILNAGPMLQLTGFTATSATNYYRPATRKIIAGNAGGLGHQWTCMNAVSAPSATRIMRANGESNDQALVTEATHKMTSEYLDDLIATAPQTIPPIRPCKWAGGENFFIFIHTDQYRDLIDDSKIDAIEMACLQGGLPFEQSPVATGNVRPYRGCIIVVSNWNPPGVHSSTGAGVANTRRAVFCGAQALACGWGVGEGENRFSFRDEKYNIGGSYRCVTRSIWGGKKVRYGAATYANSTDYATYVLTTYAENRGDTGA